jgi:hypothetical protein
VRSAAECIGVLPRVGNAFATAPCRVLSASLPRVIGAGQLERIEHRFWQLRRE